MAGELQIERPQGEYCLAERALDDEYDANPDNIYRRNAYTPTYLGKPKYSNDNSTYRSKM